MSYSISTLLLRNLHDVFGENDAARRQRAGDEIYADDCVFYDGIGKNVYRGRDELPRVKNGLGIAIVTTSQGVMTGYEARRRGIGGEVLCTVY